MKSNGPDLIMNHCEIIIIKMQEKIEKSKSNVKL